MALLSFVQKKDIIFPADVNKRKGWMSLNHDLRSRCGMLFAQMKPCMCALLLCMLCGGAPTLALETQLPVCADVAGEYLHADRAPQGARLLSSYLSVFSTVTARPYTELSRTKLYIYQTLISTPYAGRGAVTPYFEEVTQVEPYVFEDRNGTRYAFTLDSSGGAQLSIDGERWVLKGGLITPAFINATIFILQWLCLYAIVALCAILYYALKNRRLRWKSLAATRANTALTVTLGATLLTNAILLIWGVPSLPYERLWPFFALNALYLIALAALCVLIACTARKSELDTRQKIAYSLNTVCALTLLALMLLWELYH